MIRAKSNKINEKKKRSPQKKSTGHLLRDAEKWHHALNAAMQENVFLKERIASILRNNFQQSLLATLEEF